MTPIGSMGRLYIYLHENHRNELNVYTIHGSYGTGNLICDTNTIYIYIYIYIHMPGSSSGKPCFLDLQTRGIRKITFEEAGI